MMEPVIRHIPQQTALELAEQIQILPGQVVSKTLAQNAAVSLTLFAFDKGEEISTHASQGDAMVTVLEGAARLTIGGREYFAQKGQTIIMPRQVPHAVFATEAFKMFLTVIFPTKEE